MTTTVLKPFSVVEDILRRVVAASPYRKACGLYFDDETRLPVCGIGNVLADFAARPAGYASNYCDAVVTLDDEFIVGEGEGVEQVRWVRVGIEAPNAEQAKWVKTFQQHQDGVSGVVGKVVPALAWGDALQAADTERAGAQA